jgi:hypothetical protein
MKQRSCDVSRRARQGQWIVAGYPRRRLVFALFFAGIVLALGAGLAVLGLGAWRAQPSLARALFFAVPPLVLLWLGLVTIGSAVGDALALWRLRLTVTIDRRWARPGDAVSVHIGLWPRWRTRLRAVSAELTEAAEVARLEGQPPVTLRTTAMLGEPRRLGAGERLELSGLLRVPADCRRDPGAAQPGSQWEIKLQVRPVAGPILELFFPLRVEVAGGR